MSNCYQQINFCFGGQAVQRLYNRLEAPNYVLTGVTLLNCRIQLWQLYDVQHLASVLTTCMYRSVLRTNDKNLCCLFTVESTVLWVFFDLACHLSSDYHSLKLNEALYFNKYKSFYNFSTFYHLKLVAVLRLNFNFFPVKFSVFKIHIFASIMRLQYYQSTSTAFLF